VEETLPFSGKAFRRAGKLRYAGSRGCSALNIEAKLERCFYGHENRIEIDVDIWKKSPYLVVKEQYQAP
jgi:hypothetical protein